MCAVPAKIKSRSQTEYVRRSLLGRGRERERVEESVSERPEDTPDTPSYRASDKNCDVNEKFVLRVFETAATVTLRYRYRAPRDTCPTSSRRMFVQRVCAVCGSSLHATKRDATRNATRISGDFV